jgi:hypothetical protein
MSSMIQVEITLIEFDALNLMQLENQFRFHRLNRSGPLMRIGECELVVRIETACPGDIRRFAEAMIKPQKSPQQEPVRTVMIRPVNPREVGERFAGYRATALK